MARARAGIFNGQVLRDIPSRGQCLTCCVPAGRSGTGTMGTTRLCRRTTGPRPDLGIDAEVTLAVMSIFPGVLYDGRRGALDGCVPGPEVSNEGSEFGGTFERGEGA